MSELYPQYSSGPQPTHFRGLTLGRLDRFEGGRMPNITDVLFEERVDSGDLIHIESWSSPGRTKTPFKEAITKPFKPAKKGDEFGPSWTHHWFKVSLDIPKAWAKKERIQFEWDPSAEAMIFDTEGLPLQGITGGFGIDRRVDFLIDPKYAGTTVKFFIETSCNGMFGNGAPETNDPPDNNRMFRLASADLVVPRMEAWRLMWDFRTIRDLARNLPDNSPLGNRCLEVGNEIMNVFRVDDFSTIDACRKIAAAKVFGVAWEEDTASLFEDPSTADTWAIGNCHIDTAWLWPFSATRQKSARSWSTQLDLMRRYPEYRFVASQAQQHAWLEKDYPLLFQEVKKYVDKGQFDLIGGAWVECDTNMPSGEAMARQFLYGQRFFKSRYGQYTRTFWLPDSFGYSSQIPQLCRLAGMDFFFTQKMSWSQFNTFPHNTFRWVGQDGTQIVTHMTPVDTYTAQASVGDVTKSINNNKSQQSLVHEALLVYGNGDGGGGPLAPMVENLRRVRAVANAHPREIPKVTMGQSVEDFYDAVLAKSDGGRTLPTWDGELYLELHRGTYTSHHANKRNNRKSELLLRDVEFLGTLASLGAGISSVSVANHAAKAYHYPKDAIDPIWEDVLLCQFHDVLPGSAIGMVYEDSDRLYAAAFKHGTALVEAALDALLPGTTSELEKGAGDLISVNTLPWARREVVRVPLSVARSLTGTGLQLAASTSDGNGPAILDACISGYNADVSAPSASAYVVFEHTASSRVARARGVRAASGPRVSATLCAQSADITLSNETLRATISSDGRITSLYDLEKERELLSAPAGFVLFEDQPLNWDAWDVDMFHLEKKQDVTATSVRITEAGPVRATVEAVYHIGQSTVTACISLDAEGPLADSDTLAPLRFDVALTWHERHVFLKFETPLALRAAYATYENQFGCVQRATHMNTSWDKAKFEVVGHKFADLSEHGYGVALLNDCKYGYSCIGSTLRLSLLRCSTAPDAEQDQGDHTLSFALLPHRGSFHESTVPAAAWLFNVPPRVRRAVRYAPAPAPAPDTFSYDGDANVILSNVKRGEDDDFLAAKTHKTVILRLYEAYGGAGRGTVTIANLDVESVTVCDLLERDIEPVGITSQTRTRTVVKVSLKPFQVLSLKVVIN